MDADETLADIRKLLSPPRELSWVDSGRLANLVGALGDWLTHGGPLPKEWRHE
jgi:hypothetical protein